MDPSAQVDPDNDEVFISGLPPDTTEQDIAEYFGQIGVIKQVSVHEKQAERVRSAWVMVAECSRDMLLHTVMLVSHSFSMI